MPILVSCWGENMLCFPVRSLRRCLEPQWVTTALGVTGTPSQAGVWWQTRSGLWQQRAHFPVNFRNIGAAQQATALRSNVHTRVGTTCVYRETFVKDHKYSELLFLGSLGFSFLPNPRAVLFLCVFQTNLQSSYKLLYLCSTGAWTAHAFGSRPQ